MSQYRDGKHVVLAVDVTKKDSAIMKEVGKLLGRIKKDYERPKDATKDKDTVETFGKFTIIKQKTGLNFTQIARKLSGEKGNPTYNAKLKARLESVKRRRTQKSEENNKYGGTGSKGNNNSKCGKEKG